MRRVQPLQRVVELRRSRGLVLVGQFEKPLCTVRCVHFMHGLISSPANAGAEPRATATD